MPCPWCNSTIKLCQNNIYNQSETSLTDCGKEEKMWASPLTADSLLVDLLMWLMADERRYAESTGHFHGRCRCEVMWWQSRVVGHRPLDPCDPERMQLARANDSGKATPITDYKIKALHCYSNTSSNTYIQPRSNKSSATFFNSAVLLYLQKHGALSSMQLILTLEVRGAITLDLMGEC